MVDMERHDPAGGPPDLGALQQRLFALHDAYQQTPARYAATAPLLPGLVRDVGQTVRSFTTAGEASRRREAYRLGADLYLLVRPIAKYLHRPELMLMAADRAVFYAEATDDPIRMAVAQWNLAQALCSSNEADNAQDIALTAIQRLQPETSREGTQGYDAQAVAGSLHLVASIAEVRAGDPWTARRRLREKALPMARKLGEGNAYYLCFGPANVAAYMVAVEMEAGEAAEAIRIADSLALGDLRTIERRATHLLTLARCHEFRQDDAAILLTLLRLEREAPEDVRYRSGARDLIRGLLNRARPTFAPEVRELANRVGLLATA
jgi:hypothetical protein